MQKEIRLKPEEWESLKEKAEKADSYFDQLLRLQAEFENTRKRLQKEKEEHTKYAHGDLVRELLPVYDHFALALASIDGKTSPEMVLKGITLIKNEMWDFLADRGLSRIEAVGHPFDPESHEAVATVEDETHPENTVVEEIRAGYRLNGKLLRPASVKISKHKREQMKPDEGGDSNG